MKHILKLKNHLNKNDIGLYEMAYKMLPFHRDFFV